MYNAYMGVNDRCPNAQICRGLGTCVNPQRHYHALCFYYMETPVAMVQESVAYCEAI